MLGTNRYRVVDEGLGALLKEQPTIDPVISACFTDTCLQKTSNNSNENLYYSHVTHHGG